LTPKEYGPDGVLSTFSKWLRENLEKFNFFFPYQKDLGGVMPEPWHIAHGPSSTKFMKSYSLEIFKQNLLQSDLELKKVCKENSLSFYQNYFQNISPNPWEMNSIS